MNIPKALELIEGAVPLWNRMNEDQKRITAFKEDWLEAVKNARASGDLKALEVLLEALPALLYKVPTRFSWDPFKGFRLLADDLARALDFKRYKERRNLD